MLHRDTQNWIRRTLHAALAVIALCSSLLAASCTTTPSDSASETEKQRREEILERDQAIKQDIIDLRAAVELCREARGTYARCDEKRELDASLIDDLRMGVDPGEVHVEKAARFTHLIVGRTADGSRFSIERAQNGAERRRCSALGVGLCEADSTW